MKRLSLILLALALLMSAAPVAAQEPTPPSGPIYIIQPGDTLSNIAARFNVPLADLMAANNITNANAISAGAQLIIPGLEGLSGYLVTEVVPYGDNLLSLSRRYQVSPALLSRLNRITSPTELYAGISLVVLQDALNTSPLAARFGLETGQTLLEQAVLQQTDPWRIADANGLSGTWQAMPGDVLYSPVPNAESTASGLPSAILSTEVPTLPLKQGGTAVINARVQPGVSLTGVLVDKPLRFFPNGDGLTALQGVHALLKPGVYPLRLEATLPDGSKQSFEQMVVVRSGDYPDDPVLIVEPATIDVAVTEPENQQIEAITSFATPERYWDGRFTSPGYDPTCFTSRYGNRRTYKSTDGITSIQGFHTGADFCGGQGLPIVAPANGKVVFAGPLTVRGYATIIDHGWGVFSGIWHQSEIKVQVGQQVQAGELIGIVGGTGRVTGAHLHWELWVNGVQVNPIDWLDKRYP